MCIRFIIIDNFDKRCSDAYFVPFLFYYYCNEWHNGLNLFQNEHSNFYAFSWNFCEILWFRKYQNWRNILGNRICIKFTQLSGKIFSPSGRCKKLSHHFLLHFPIGMGSYDHQAKYQGVFPLLLEHTFFIRVPPFGERKFK